MIKKNLLKKELRMHKILQDEKLDRIESVYEWYKIRLIEIAEEKDNTLSTIEIMLDIKSVGWQSFENGKSLEDNPFRKGLNDDFGWWQEGWEQAREEINLLVENHLEHGLSLL